MRIWSRVDLGTARKEDLFITTGQYEAIPIDIVRPVFEERPLIDPNIEELDTETGEITQKETTSRSKFRGLL